MLSNFEDQTRQLTHLILMADELLEKLREANKRWEGLPDFASVDRLVESTDSLNNSLNSAVEAWNSLPNERALDDLARSANLLSEAWDASQSK